MATANVRTHYPQTERVTHTHLRVCRDCGAHVPARQMARNGLICRECERDLIVARKGYQAIARKGYPTAAGRPQGGW